MASPDDFSAGPTVRPSDHLHSHVCEECHHSWTCTSASCLAIRNAHISNPLTWAPSPATQISDHCRDCRRSA